MEKIKNQKHFCCVDLLKFICSLLVVAIHTAPLSSYNVYLHYALNFYIARLAVPFFFVSSGYFFFSKTLYKQFNSKISMNYVKKIFRLYVIWSVIYLPIVIYNNISIGTGFLKATIIWMIRFIFVESYAHLWYLNGIIIAVLILTFLIIKKLNILYIFIIASIMYAIGLLAQSYFIVIEPFKSVSIIWSTFQIFQKVLVTTRNGLFFGLLFMTIGMIFAYKNIVIKLERAIMCFFISMLLLLAEMVIVIYCGWAKNMDADMYIFLVPTVFFYVLHIYTYTT